MEVKIGKDWEGRRLGSSNIMGSEGRNLPLMTLVFRGLSDLAVYPLLSMSVIMQGTQPYSTLPRQSDAIETRIYTQRGGTSTAPWKQALPCVRAYRDTLDPYYIKGFTGQYKGLLLINILRSSQILLLMGWRSSIETWWDYAKLCAMQVGSVIVTKPLKTAFTRFVLQNREMPAYQSLRQYFTTVSVREMYQGLPYTIAKELILFLQGTQQISVAAFVAVGYPCILAETRMEAMSAHKGLQPYRYTNRTVLTKILAEEGLFGLYRGLFAFGLYVSATQQSFHMFVVLAVLAAYKSYVNSLQASST